MIDFFTALLLELPGEYSMGIISDPGEPWATARAAGYVLRSIFSKQGPEVILCTRQSLPTVIELQMLRARPRGQGHGTVVADALMRAADATSTLLWLDLIPDGDFPAETSRRFYLRRGFNEPGGDAVIPACWRNGWPNDEITVAAGIPMIRLPQAPAAPSEDGSMEEDTDQQLRDFDSALCRDGRRQGDNVDALWDGIQFVGGKRPPPPPPK
jgi:hypothetical protein